MITASRLGLGLGLATILVLGGSSIAQAQYQAPPPSDYTQAQYQAPPPGYYAPPPRYAYPPPRYAYPPPPPPPRRYGMYRDGLVLGFALGAGGIEGNCNANDGFCGGAFSGELHIGGMMNPRLALMLDIWGNFRDINGTDTSFSQTFWTAALQYWVAEMFWLKAGLGISHVQVSDDINGVDDDDTALGLMLGAGVEVLQVGNMALDLQFRAGFGFYNPTLDNYAFLVGLSWY